MIAGWKAVDGGDNNEYDNANNNGDTMTIVVVTETTMDVTMALVETMMSMVVIWEMTIG